MDVDPLKKVPQSEPLPLISCLCVTHGRPGMLNRVIQCFNYQSYPNKQLIIVYDDFDMATDAFISKKKIHPNIKVIKVDSTLRKKTLGELRNISIDHSDGDFVCQWDDDDWYHKDRLKFQLSHLMFHGKSASILSQWVVFDNSTGKAYFSNKRLWEGSILCKKDLMLLKPYPSKSKGEDTDTITFLHKRGELSIIEDTPYLYVYIFHGENTWEDEHFKEILRSSSALSHETSLQITRMLNGDEPIKIYANIFLDQLKDLRLA